MFSEKPKAYGGDKPFIFISYAHKDAEIVIPIICELQNGGHRIWYDEGIAPGSNWDIYISEQLDASSNVICFLSKAYVRSKNCRDELALSRLKGKPVIIVYLDDVELSPGLKMRYGRIQALFYNNTNRDEFFDKLCKADIMTASKE